MNEKPTSLRIDVRQPEDAAVDPWADAVNLPVYQMDFVDKVKEKVDGVFGSTFEGVPAASATFEIDRTEWGALYGSPRFFHRLMGHFVRERVSLSVTLVAK